TSVRLGSAPTIFNGNDLPSREHTDHTADRYELNISQTRTPYRTRSNAKPRKCDGQPQARNDLRSTGRGTASAQEKMESGNSQGSNQSSHTFISSAANHTAGLDLQRGDSWLQSSTTRLSTHSR